jgi:hypothetical protein
MSGKLDAIGITGGEKGKISEADFSRDPVSFPSFDSFTTSISLLTIRDSLKELRGKLSGISYELQHPNDPPPLIHDEDDIRETIILLLNDCNRIESDIRRELLARGVI